MTTADQIPLTLSGHARCFAPSIAHMLRWPVIRPYARGPIVCPVCLDLLERRVAETTAESYEDHARAYTERANAAAHMAWGTR